MQVQSLLQGRLVVRRHQLEAAEHPGLGGQDRLVLPAQAVAGWQVDDGVPIPAQAVAGRQVDDGVPITTTKGYFTEYPGVAVQGECLFIN